MTMIRDLEGNPVPTGRVHRTLVEPFLNTTTLPSWLVASREAADVTIVPPTSSAGYAQIDAPPGNIACGIQTAFAFNTSHFDEIRLTVEGLRFGASAGFLVNFALNGSGTGIGLIEKTSPSYVFLRSVGSPNVDTPVPMRIYRVSEGPRHRNMSLVLRPRLKMAYVMADDQIMTHLEMPSLVNGLINPKIILSSEDGVAKHLRVSQIRLDLISN